MKMRLDKLMSAAGLLTRSECTKAARAGRITVNGATAKNTAMQVDPGTDTVALDGVTVSYSEFVYVMLHKPDGYVSATEDGRDPTVVELLSPELQKRALFPCGRLDKHTTGLMLLTDNGPLGHRLLAPKSHVAKTYAFKTKFPLSGEDIAALESGVPIETKDGGSYMTAPARVRLTNAERTAGEITIVEGKYHQIKFMMIAVHNQITSLSRISFGALTLDPTLAPGEWRLLTPEEIRAIGG